MATGYIKTVKSERDFGFIAQAGADDIWFHVAELEGDLVDDENLIERPVEFDVVTPADGRRPKAVNSRPLSPRGGTLRRH
jgi:cold shock CspA family protein